ncbi:hypothetical protein C404_11210 [Ralstonia sp. AU12-08]|nr:hypothetical protein C404_11210 [Ralstonia sp. AU12-08]
MIFRTAGGRQDGLQQAASDAGLHVQEERKRTSFRRVRAECARSAAQQCISPILQRSIGE